MQSKLQNHLVAQLLTLYNSLRNLAKHLSIRLLRLPLKNPPLKNQIKKGTRSPIRRRRSMRSPGRSPMESPTRSSVGSHMRSPMGRLMFCLWHILHMLIGLPVSSHMRILTIITITNALRRISLLLSVKT